MIPPGTPNPAHASAFASAPGENPAAAARLLHRLLWTLPILALVAIGAYWIWSRAANDSPRQHGALPVLAQAPSFSLTEACGRTVTQADLAGKPWLANFIFTRCTGPCPELSLRMRSLQKTFTDRGGDVRFITFTLDPDYDKPPVLAEYAKRHYADAGCWWFLTGTDQVSMHRLVREGFLQAVVPAHDDVPLVHSTYFVLVDGRGRIRGFYDGLDPSSRSRIVRDVDSLLAEPPGS